MIGSNPYDAFEERLETQRTARLDKDRILNEEAEEKRRRLQVQKKEKFAKTDLEEQAQNKELAEEERVKNDAL